MAAYSSSRRGRSPAKTALSIVLLLLLACGGTVGALAAAGVVKFPWMRAREPSHAGQVFVPLSARVLPAYHRVLREDLFADSQHVAGSWVAKADVRPGTFTDLGQIIGRVLDHEKGSNYSFSEDDFLPIGTRPGLVAGIPPGKRSLTIEAAKIPGLHGLAMGDRFDVVATIKPDAGHPNGQGPPPSKQPEVRVLVSNGMMISAIRIRATPTTTNSLMNGQRTSTKPVEEVVIAIEPDEIAELTAAMTLEAAIMCVARSGHPDETDASITPGLPPEPPPTTIEAVRGNKTETLYFPLQSESDENRPQRPRLPSQRWLPPGRSPLHPSDRVPVAASQPDQPYESR